jgi:hypothetical protein
MIKNILKEIWEGLTGFPYTTNEPPEEHVKVTDPVIDSSVFLAEQEKIGQSKKILDIVLKDLEKFPPHEWDACYSPYGHITFKNSCLNYTLCRYYSIYVPYLKIEGKFLTLDDQKILHDKFYIPFANVQDQNRVNEYQKAMNDFLDEDKRILCKDATIND